MTAATQPTTLERDPSDGQSVSRDPASRLSRALDDLASRPLGHHIDGVSEHVGDGPSLEVVNPATGEVIAHVGSGGPHDVDRAVKAARRAFRSWRATPVGERSAVLLKIADLVEANLDELIVLESLNCGKPFGVAHGETAGVAEIFRYMAGASRALQAPAPDEYLADYLSLIRREPHGVIGAITPWNYPLLTASWKMAAALAMGNTCVLKPSEMTPLTTLRFMELVAETLPPGVLNVVVGTGEVIGKAISEHPNIDMVSLTGSVASGQHVLSAAAQTLKPAHLELGGKAPVVVFADADLDKVAEGVRSAGYFNTGQECGAGTRVICHESIHDRLVEKLVAVSSTLRLGSPSEAPEPDLGPLISETQRERVSSMVDRAKAAGATIALGGHIPEGPGYFYPPTVVTHIAAGAEITAQEIFGPVVTVETFKDDAEAVTLANNTPYGLAGSVWTGNVGRAIRLTGELDFGTVWVNVHLVATVEMPWGGFGASGHGRECSTLGLEDFSRTKHIMIALGERPGTLPD